MMQWCENHLTTIFNNNKKSIKTKYYNTADIYYFKNNINTLDVSLMFKKKIKIGKKKKRVHSNPTFYQFTVQKPGSYTGI